MDSLEALWAIGWCRTILILLAVTAAILFLIRQGVIIARHGPREYLHIVLGMVPYRFLGFCAFILVIAVIVRALW
ncbi:MAG: hypothetical protein ACYTAF_02755 [Planctomycetota bacterium]|jgi:hypothetical protein